MKHTSDNIHPHRVVITWLSIVLLFIAGTMTAFAEDKDIIIRKSVVGKRVLIEEHVIEYKYYKYSIADLNDSISHIRNTTERMYYNLPHYTGPRYNDYMKYRDDINRVKSITLYYFLSKGKDAFLKKKNTLNWVSILLRNNGDVVVSDFTAMVSLLTFCTPEEIVGLFDEIGAYKFAAPIVPESDYKDGYLLTGKGICYPEYDKEDYQEEIK